LHVSVNKKARIFGIVDLLTVGNDSIMFGSSRR